MSSYCLFELAPVWNLREEMNSATVGEMELILLLAYRETFVPSSRLDTSASLLLA